MHRVCCVALAVGTAKVSRSVVVSTRISGSQVSQPPVATAWSDRLVEQYPPSSPAPSILQIHTNNQHISAHQGIQLSSEDNDDTRSHQIRSDLPLDRPIGALGLVLLAREEADAADDLVDLCRGPELLLGRRGRRRSCSRSSAGREAQFGNGGGETGCARVRSGRGGE